MVKTIDHMNIPSSFLLFLDVHNGIQGENDIILYLEIKA
jgi:hypothetical protein